MPFGFAGSGAITFGPAPNRVLIFRARANPRQRTGSHSDCELFHQISRMHPLQRLSHRRENQMDREQLEQVRKSVDAQLRWAMLHDGDQELLEVLLFERHRLSVLMRQMPRSSQPAPVRTFLPCADRSRVLAQSAAWLVPPV